LFVLIIDLTYVFISAWMIVGLIDAFLFVLIIDLTYVFISALMIVGLIGAFLFVLIQLVLIIDFAHGWAESWVEKYEDTESKCYYFGRFLSLNLTDAMHTLLKGAVVVIIIW
jgi:hypothetical protein